MILYQAIVDYFKYKGLRNIIVLACWSEFASKTFIRELSLHGFSSTVSCDPDILENVQNHHLQGIIYFKQYEDSLLTKLQRKYLNIRYKWLIIGDNAPSSLNYRRYDLDMALMKVVVEDTKGQPHTKETFIIDDIYPHPRDGVTLHPWAVWSPRGLQVMFDREKILRRQDLMNYPIKIVSPRGAYSREMYDGTYEEYLVDRGMSEHDAAIRCAYHINVLIIEALKAKKEVIIVDRWGTEGNSSMMDSLRAGEGDLGGGILRMLPHRLHAVDFILPIWPFSNGFTYLAERESSSNMFVEPFSSGVWLISLAIFLVLAVALRVTAKSRFEKQGAYISVLATWLQQDAGSVPAGASGRWTFLVLSICSMLVHAYYTSAIVSALMSSGTNGPKTLDALGDSKYDIASEDYEYMRYLMFDVQTNWPELEYLKKKKMTSEFYQTIERGAELVRAGNTAYHTEYNQFYPYLKTFSDESLCKLSYVDTIPEVLTWVPTTKMGQWLEVFRSTGGWLHETGLAKRVLLQLRTRPPPCMAALLAERVKFGDVASAVILSMAGVFMSVVILGLEIVVKKWKRGTNGSQKSLKSSLDYVD